MSKRNKDNERVGPTLRSASVTRQAWTVLGPGYLRWVARSDQELGLALKRQDPTDGGGSGPGLEAVEAWKAPKSLPPPGGEGFGGLHRAHGPEKVPCPNLDGSQVGSRSLQRVQDPWVSPGSPRVPQGPSDIPSTRSGSRAGSVSWRPYRGLDPREPLGQARLRVTMSRHRPGTHRPRTGPNGCPGA